MAYKFMGKQTSTNPPVRRLQLLTASNLEHSTAPVSCTISWPGLIFLRFYSRCTASRNIIAN